MQLIRTILFLSLGTSALLFVLFVLTKQTSFKRWGLLVLRWTVAAALVFFAVLFVQRLV